MTTYVYGTGRDLKWDYRRPQDFLPQIRRFSRKQLNRFLRSGHPEHHTKKVWHNISRLYRRQGLVYIEDIGWVSPDIAERYRLVLETANQPIGGLSGNTPE